MTVTMMMPFLLMELPSELVLRILTRLPLKYLMRLRCVSKFFLDLTNNPNFITSYRKSNPPPPLPPPPPPICPFLAWDDPRPPPPPPPLPRRHRPNSEDHDFNFIETSPPPPPPPSHVLHLCLSSNSNPNPNPWPWRFHMLFKGSNFIYLQKRHELIPFHCPTTKRLINSINGLVCFGGPDSLEIYNIFAGTNCYLIPQIFLYSVRDPVFAFGYDPISHDYKILRIEHFCSWSIYSFRTNSWKPMSLEWDHTTVYFNSEGGRSVCINGVIYWPPSCPRYDPYPDKIVLFHLHKEKFGVIQLPKQDLLLPTQYTDIQLLSFRGCLAFAFIRRRTSGTTTTATTTTKSRKRMRSGGRGGGSGPSGGEGEKATNSSHGVVVGVGEICVELFTLTLAKMKKITLTLEKNSLWNRYSSKKKSSWNRHSFVVPIPSPTKEEEVEIVSCCDEIFLGWFESNQLRLYNLHTKHIFNLPLSPSSHYYPKASFMEKMKKENDNPTYVNNLSFDFSLI